MEEWREIKGFENYLVSNTGLVRRIDGLIMKQRLSTKKKYLIVGLRKNGKQHTFLAHRLVASMFYENKENKPEVNHKDGITTNNNKSNLEWVTRIENITHSLDVLGNREKLSINSKFKGASGTASLRARKVVGIDKNGIKYFYSFIEETRKDGFNPKAVCNCCLGTRKTHQGLVWRYS